MSRRGRSGPPWHQVRATRENMAMRALQASDPSVSITGACLYACGYETTRPTLERASLDLRQHYAEKHGGQPEDR